MISKEPPFDPDDISRILTEGSKKPDPFKFFGINRNKKEIIYQHNKSNR